MWKPLEDTVVTISRATGTLTFPANFMLVAAMNPCACGYFGDPIEECTCSLSMITRYGPTPLCCGDSLPNARQDCASGHSASLARCSTAVRSLSLCEIDIHAEVPRVDYDKLTSSTVGEAKAILIYGYDHDDWPLEVAIDAFEALASMRYRLGPRQCASFDGLVHPIHSHGTVYAWRVEHTSIMKET